MLHRQSKAVRRSLARVPVGPVTVVTLIPLPVWTVVFVDAFVRLMVSVLPALPSKRFSVPRLL